MGSLYIVSTPIGNLQDITFRAMKVLQTVDVIACEDTRRTGMLLKGVIKDRAQHKPVSLSYHEHNEFSRIPQLISQLKTGFNVALVSDAGTPTISDPGYKLVRECIIAGIKVESIPGPSAAIAALTVSGLPTDKFLFVGYLPHKRGNRKKVLEQIKNVGEILKQTIIIYEAPHKILKTLFEIEQVFGNISIVVGRELTKLHEEIRREKISESIAHFEKTKPKGEFVLLFTTKQEIID